MHITQSQEAFSLKTVIFIDKDDVKKVRFIPQSFDDDKEFDYEDVIGENADFKYRVPVNYRLLTVNGRMDKDGDIMSVRMIIGIEFELSNLHCVRAKWIEKKMWWPEDVFSLLLSKINDEDYLKDDDDDAD